MTILVTGGAGYIGSLLIQELAKSKKYGSQKIRILDSMFRERYVTLWNLPEGKYEFVEGDVRKKEDVERAFVDVDLVFDLAGITNAPLSFERKELTHEVNVGGAKNIIESAMKHKASLVYSSSASVYGPTNGVVDENYQCKPVSPYGASKLEAEREIMKATEKGLRATILRLGTVYGWSIGMRFDTVVDRFCFLAAIGSPLGVYDTAMHEKRPYLHIKDSVRAFIFSAEHLDKMNGGIYNVVGENASIGVVVESIKKSVSGVEVKITSTPSLNQLSYVTDDSKIRALGFKTEYNMDDGTRDVLEKFRPLLGSRLRLK